MKIIRCLGCSSIGSSPAVDKAVVDLRKVVGPLQIAALVKENYLKELEAQEDCAVSPTSYCILLDRLC